MKLKTWARILLTGIIITSVTTMVCVSRDGSEKNDEDIEIEE